MTALPPDGPEPPPGVPPQLPRAGWAQPAPREARGVSFFVAIFLGILLVASAGLNVLLLLLSVGSLAGAGLADDGAFDEVHVAGERGAPNRVLKVAIHGPIAETQNPLLGAVGGAVTQARRALQRAADADVHAVLLDIDSPGGGVTDSDEIYELVRKFRRDHPKKPVLALFGDVAASGGYYVAVAAERIVARRTTITGSIGVIMSSYDVTEGLGKLGVREVVIKSDRTPYKDILSPTRPMTEEERVMLTRIVDELYDRFVSVVDEGRADLDREQVLAVANGAIYTAAQAAERGLVDEIGDEATVLAWLSQRLGGAVDLFERRRRPTFAERLLGSRAAPASVDRAVDRLLHGSSGPRFLYYWEGGR